MRILALLLCCAWTAQARAGTESPVWSGYLDYAYVYSSAEPAALKARLAEYGQEADISLQRYIADYFETLAPLESDEENETAARRRAIAYLLDYLARGAPESLEASMVAVHELDSRLERLENRYWYHYVRAHHALERGYASDFVEELLALWVWGVVPLESTYERLDVLSLSDAPNSGFVSALPFIHENIARLILIKSQRAGLDQDLDPLAAIVRLLWDGRVGAHPDVIPREASSRAYLERIIERLDGPESDAGSLTFTLTLFEAARHHDRARALLASEDLSPDTLRAMRQASGAYETALARAGTVQGRTAVYTRVLRLLGELFAARQRLGVDPEIEMPFSIEGAMQVYFELAAGLDGDWRALGYRNVDRPRYVASLRGLWEEIQEASLNSADYFLSRGVAEPHRADEHSRSAGRIYGRYLAFFYEFANEEQKEGVPDSAYFAAFEAARGFGDAFLTYAADARSTEVELATQRYRSALSLFPFDRALWPQLTAALERYGREGEYADLVRPIADGVARSRVIHAWIENGEPFAEQIASVRRALADSLVVMYLGFAEADAIGELETELRELRERRVALDRELAELTRERDRLRRADLPASAAEADRGRDLAALDLAQVGRQIADHSALMTRLDQQISARSRALPLYKQTLDSDGLTRELRTQRDHPVHLLLRRMYHENLSRASGA